MICTSLTSAGLTHLLAFVESSLGALFVDTIFVDTNPCYNRVHFQQALRQNIAASCYIGKNADQGLQGQPLSLE